MPEFLELLPPEEARALLLRNLPEQDLEPENISTTDALGRVLASDIFSPETIPAFSRSTVDGYAVKSKDSFGASESIPAFFEIVNEVKMGEPANFSIKQGEAAVIHTGGMMPNGADAVVMIEFTQKTSLQEIEVYRAVGQGENVILKGEDIGLGEIVLMAGKKIRPVEIAGLMALGITKVEVLKKPVVGIISTGDEIVSPESQLRMGQVRDINSYSLSGIVSDSGGEPIRYGIIRDEPSLLEEVTKKALSECDLVLITAGSSASFRDHTANVIQRSGNPGVLVHGVNVKPGKPTILGVCDGKPVIGLPGNPVSAYVIAELFVKPVISKIAGENSMRRIVFHRARVTINISSVSGREDWVPVRILEEAEDGTILVEPIFFKSNLIFTLTNADGLIRIPPEANGIQAFDLVEMKIL